MNHGNLRLISLNRVAPKNNLLTRVRKRSSKDDLFFLTPRELLVQIFVYILSIHLKIVQVSKFLEPINISVPQLTYQSHNTPTYQHAFGPLKKLIKRGHIFYHLPFFNFSDIYDVIIHSICNIEHLATLT